ncbi:MAG: helix-turn-helix domain-containing protein [Anaerolineae bacterium]
MLVITLVVGIVLIVCTALSSIPHKGARRIVLLLPVITGLLLTTLVHAADAEINQDGEEADQHQILILLEVAGVGLTIVGICGLLSKIRVASLWMPNDTPFESYKPFKPAYTSTFPISPIVTPPIFEHSSMTLSEAARYLRISEHDVRMLIDEGSILATQRGASYLITRRALDDFAYHEQFRL